MSLLNLISISLFAGASSVSVAERTKENLTCCTRVATSLDQGSWSKLTVCTVIVVNNRESYYYFFVLCSIVDQEGIVLLYGLTIIHVCCSAHAHLYAQL